MVIDYLQPVWLTFNKMDVKDSVANATTLGGIFAYLMHFQGELTVLLLLTGLMLNITRLVDWFRKKDK